MAGNPLVALGALNRLKSTVVWNSFASLNITPSYLGKNGIRVSPKGPATAIYDVMAGIVPSPEPYIRIGLMLPLLKTQALSNLYKVQMEANSVLGDCTVRPDVAPPNGLGIYQFSNMSITEVGELSFDGSDPVYMVSLEGIYYVNSSLWD